jgi:hypothetical protein
MGSQIDQFGAPWPSSAARDAEHITYDGCWLPEGGLPGWE